MKKLVLITLMFIFTAQAYSQHLFTIKQLEKIASYNSKEGPHSVKDFVNKYGFFKKGKLYSDINKFTDSYGNTLETIQVRSKTTGKVTFTVIFGIKDPSVSVRQEYTNYLNKNYRKKASLYDQNGRYIIDIQHKTEKSFFEVTVYNNTNFTFTSYAKKVGDRKFEIFPYTTAVFIKFAKGSKLNLSASGTMTLGTFVGKSGPNGIQGYQVYNYISGMPHGSLMGKFGENGKWFLIGSKKTITVNKEAILYVRVNDRDLANNYGSYFLEYSFANSSTNSSANNNTTFSVQCVSGNCTNGFGKKRYSNDTYEGQFKSNFRHGRGVYIWSNGEKYEGDWVEGKKEGQGTLTLINGNKYIGGFKNDNREGKGVEYDKNGNILYNGQWKNNKRTSQARKKSYLSVGCTSGNCINGYGKYRYNNGIYSGFFKNGKRNGHGHFSWNNGDFYLGNWSNDLRNDYGSYFWKDGSHYTGEWKNNIRTGYGLKKSAKGVYSRGIWQNGKLISPYTFTKNENTTKGCTYGNCTNGYGQLVYDNGEKFTGFFINGKRYAGTYRYKNGDLYQGQFGTDDSFTGYGYYLWKNRSYYRGQFKNFKRNGIGFYMNKTDNSEMKGIWANGKLTTSY